MKTDIISNYDEFLKIEKEYTDLWESSVDRNIFNSPIFLKSYIKSFSETYKLHIICLRNNGILVGIAPLKILKKSFFLLKWNEVRFATEGDYRSFIIRKKIKESDIGEDQIIKNLVFEIDKLNCERICLDYISQHSSLYKYLSKNDDLNPKLSYHIQVPKLNMYSFENFENYKKHFPKKTNKYRNKLINDHDYILSVTDKMNDSLLDEMAELHIKEKNYHIDNGNNKRYSLYEDDDRKKYIFDLQKDSKYVLHFMMRRKSDDKLICYRNTYTLDDTIYSWNTAYDPEFSSYRVNNTFFYEIFKYLFEYKSYKFFNFGSGGYPWKFSFTDDFDVLFKLDYFNKNGKFIEKLLKLKKYFNT